jgi:hypothetical protein
MLAKTGRMLDMGTRVLEFTRKHPDSSPALASAVGRLKELLDRADGLAHQQLDGRSEVHAATARKAELRRLIRGRHLKHLRRVAEVASADEPELEQKFMIPRDTHTYRGFHTAATGMVAEAASRKELLVKHGLDEEVLTGLQVALDQFETAVEQGAAGRLAHVGATAELNQIAEDVVQVVGVMTTIIHVRFVNQPEILAAWESASNVVAAPKSHDATPSGGTSPTGGEVKPAA